MIRDGADPGGAALIGRAVMAELRQDASLPELFLIQRTDSFGERHDIVVRQIPPGDAKPLYQFDIRMMRRAARQAIAAEFDVQLQTAHGTEI